MPPERTTLSRRRLLAVAGAGFFGVAGCTGGGDSDASAPSPTITAGRPQTPTSKETADRTAPPTPAQPTENPEIARMEEALGSVAFQGEYFDTHAHWQGRQMGVPSAYAVQMENHDIGASVLFSPSRLAATDYESFLQSVTDPGVDYLPFMSAPPPGPRLSTELESLYEAKGGAFWGIGEWKPQGSPVRAFDGDQLTRLWELAATLDVPVMYHPFPEQEGEVEAALEANPETTFLLHGHQMLSFGQERPGLGPTLPRLLDEYDNLYWTMDFASMTSGSLVRFRGAQQFLDWYEAKADRSIDLFSPILRELLEAGPSQVTWGTDIAWKWNMEDAVFSRVMEFTERVLTNVPEKHHAPYKHENAQALFGL